MVGDQTRDKDAISAVALICEMAAVARDRHKSLFDELIDLYVEYGLYKERLVSITRKGITGAGEIALMMQRFRENPPRMLNGARVTAILDYLTGEARDLETGAATAISLPASNVLQFKLADGSKISARPSGTEPKIKFYFSVQTILDNAAAYDAANAALEEKLDGIIRDLGL
jgi:phosphoglucomutase